MKMKDGLLVVTRFYIIPTSSVGVAGYKVTNILPKLPAQGEQGRGFFAALFVLTLSEIG
jgi:hypothetical protein